MKRLFLTLLLFVFGLTVQSQSKTFLGLSLGKAYTESEFRSAIESSTAGSYEVVFCNDTIPAILNISSLIKAEPKQLRKAGPSYYFHLTSDNELKSVSIFYDESCGLPDLVYKSLADSLSALYPMMPGVDGVGLYCSDVNGISIFLSRIDESVGLTYSDNKYLDSDIRNTNKLLGLPEIQDKFFGLILGQNYTIEKIRTTVKSRGFFEKSKRTGTGVKVIFSKIAYAGKIWDYGEFDLSVDGEFAAFSVYDSLGDSYNERKEAQKTYMYFKESLDEKYSSEFTDEEIDDTNRSTGYFGCNGIYLGVYNRRDKSEGGYYRRYVGIEYDSISVLEKTMEANLNEL